MNDIGIKLNASSPVGLPISSVIESFVRMDSEAKGDSALNLRYATRQFIGWEPNTRSDMLSFEEAPSRGS